MVAEPTPSPAVANTNPKRLLVQNSWVHVLFWNAYILIAYLTLLLGPARVKPLFWDVYIHQALAISIIYAQALVVLPVWYRRRQYGRALLGSLGVLALYSLLRYLLNYQLLPLMGVTAYSNIYQGHFWLDGVYMWLILSALGFGYYYAVDAIRKRDQILVLERKAFQAEIEAARQRERSQQLEQAKYKAELAHLRAQINPHFLFNTLNFMYAQARPFSRELAGSIMALSEMMQYAVRDLNENDLVPLAGEVHYVKNYIDLQNSRFHKQLQVDMQIEGEEYLDHKWMVPLVLVSFVENAFKHGDLTDPAAPLTIRIHVDNDEMSFFSRNKISHGQREASSGIGLENIRKRLSYIYAPDDYSLTIENDRIFYTVQLTIAYN